MQNVQPILLKGQHMFHVDVGSCLPIGIDTDQGSHPLDIHHVIGLGVDHEIAQIGYALSSGAPHPLASAGTQQPF